MTDDFHQGLTLALNLISPTKIGQARALSVSLQTVQKWCAGTSSPSESNLSRIARKANVTQEWIRSGGKEGPSADVL